jgi:hypothetical protein
MTEITIRREDRLSARKLLGLLQRSGLGERRPRRRDPPQAALYLIAVPAGLSYYEHIGMNPA